MRLGHSNLNYMLRKIFYNYSAQEKASDLTNAIQLQGDTVIQREVCQL